ncbi:Gfo/Idh/MocA family protein [Novipirellula artificiosorum]|uniref:Inositol 2-dehydrogenase/D-chiro-inositol 3-dehydrogenase n=1 Tax=Novipirellula artificiosorum TaxID=2528016 RepID=A0A5C6DYP1_9BACT|nr:Gfo/Idh/MocA family oxidoreductase [Novipirellula artificiosorum]TWU41760.1 Inositol 2-dehydrogenase/D-chiro-inositol 3-dehydrogenase [Novipirellula artificiosorum]
MNPLQASHASRRQFLKSTGTIAAASTFVAAASNPVHAAEDNTLRVALVGCGGRGTGAAMNCLEVENGPVQLVALADVFEKNLKSTHAALSGHAKVGKKVDIPEERQFVGFDAYKKALDCLRPGDIAIFATPPGFRWVHFTYAIEKGLNVFMEKPVTVDGPTSNRMLELNKQALDKNLKVGVGLMCRHCKGRQELFDRIQDGEIGDVTMMRAYRMAGPTGSAAAPPNDTGLSDLMYQISKFHGFLWLSGGAVSDFLIHNIDESCWMKNDWPIKAIAVGGRHYRGDCVDQNFDSYGIEYTFADGTKLMVDGRTIPGCKQEFASFAHGTKGLAVISSASHTPAKSRIYEGHNFDKSKITWAFPQPEPNPYYEEWVDLIEAIRTDTPYNEVERGVMASAVTSMGRMAAHTGQEITLEHFMSQNHEFAPEIDKLTLESESPLKANAEGRYSIPMPGLVKKREYL